jgi:hypothetical protein
MEINFNDADRNSSTWNKIRRHYEARLETMRRKNDGVLTPEETARLRGRIAEIKNLLAIGDPASDKVLKAFDAIAFDAKDF